MFCESITSEMSSRTDMLCRKCAFAMCGESSVSLAPMINSFEVASAVGMASSVRFIRTRDTEPESSGHSGTSTEAMATKPISCPLGLIV